MNDTELRIDASLLPTRHAGPSSLVQVESARAVAETQAPYAIAKRFPRDERAAIARVLNACQRPQLAENATYLYARGGTNVEGASIRLAEAIASVWGNIDYGFTELEQADGESHVQAYAIDLETNTRRTAVFVVKHERSTRQGTRTLTDPRDIYELVANQAARRVRACILSIIPGDVTARAIETCKATLLADGAATPERINLMVETMARFGVTKAMIQRRIQRDITAITPAQIAQMKLIATSLRDNVGKVEDFFTPDPTEQAPAPSLAARLTAPPPADRPCRGPGRPPKAAQPDAEPTQQPLQAPTPDVADRDLSIDTYKSVMAEATIMTEKGATRAEVYALLDRSGHFGDQAIEQTLDDLGFPRA